MDEGASNDGASFAINSHKSVGVPPKDCIGCGPFLPSEEERPRPRQAFRCLCNIMVTLQQSKEVDGTGLRLKRSLGADHSPFLTVSWRGEIGWEGCRKAVQQPREGFFWLIQQRYSCRLFGCPLLTGAV